MHRQRRRANQTGALARERRNAMRRKFGITPNEYERMATAQGGVCAICNRPERVSNRRLAVDHCHKTGKVRALLCHACNTALGKLDDDPALFDKAAEFLRHHKEQQCP